MAASYPFDPADDFLIFDGLETITYLHRMPDEVFGSVPDVSALRHRPDGVEPDLSGEIPAIFHVAKKQLVNDAKPRDELIDSDDVRWVVVSAELQSFASRFQLMCKKARSATITVVDVLIDNNSLVLTDNSGVVLTGS